ncbi:MAG: hypothetical protein R3Y67_09330 [Eubacteriales bacterium]
MSILVGGKCHESIIYATFTTFDFRLGSGITKSEHIFSGKSNVIVLLKNSNLDAMMLVSKAPI